MTACRDCNGDGYWHWFNGRGDALRGDDPCPRCDGRGVDPDDFPYDDPDRCQESWDAIMDHFEREAHPLFAAARHFGAAGRLITFGSEVRPEVADFIADAVTPTPDPPASWDIPQTIAERIAEAGRALDRQIRERMVSELPGPFDFLFDRVDDERAMDVLKYGATMVISREAIDGPPARDDVVEGHVMPDDVRLYPNLYHDDMAPGWSELDDGKGGRLEVDWEYCSWDWSTTRVFVAPDGDLYYGYDSGASYNSPFDFTTAGELTRIDRMQTWYDHLDEKIADHKTRAADPAFTQSARLTDRITEHRRNRP